MHPTHTRVRCVRACVRAGMCYMCVTCVTPGQVGGAVTVDQTEMIWGAWENDAWNDDQRGGIDLNSDANGKIAAILAASSPPSRPASSPVPVVEGRADVLVGNGKTRFHAGAGAGARDLAREAYRTAFTAGLPVAELALTALLKESGDRQGDGLNRDGYRTASTGVGVQALIAQVCSGQSSTSAAAGAGEGSSAGAASASASASEWFAVVRARVDQNWKAQSGTVYPAVPPQVQCGAMWEQCGGMRSNAGQCGALRGNGGQCGAVRGNVVR
jgi:hypothetical protein